MAYDEQLAERIRKKLADVPGLTERKMFGGVGFMVNGNMACGPVRDLLVVRVGPDAHAEALARPEASEMTFTGRSMRGFVQIAARDLKEDELLGEWLKRGVDYASTLPPKQK